jgi:divalent anion:Na+ symporter, DASS family
MSVETATLALERNRSAEQWLAVAGVGLCLWGLGPMPGVTSESWRLFCIFVATIVGAALTPLPLGAMVLLGVITLMATRTLSVRDALSGYADPTVWLVLSAVFISRAVLVTGLGRRLAFLLIRHMGHHTIGLTYALIASGALLSSVIPSSTARSGGIVYPIARGICDAFDSRPGPSARRLGAYLMQALYQADGVMSTLFITGAASNFNFLMAGFARVVAGVELTYALWLKLAVVPGVIGLVLVPWSVFWLSPPEIRQTPEAPRLAAAELERLGRFSYGGGLALGVLVSVTGLWITQSWHGLEPTPVALLGVGLMLVCRVVSWEDLVGDRGAWDVFLWYGGLLMMGTALGKSGVMEALAAPIGDLVANWATWLAVALMLVVYFAAHYFFASVTAHATALYGTFLSLLLFTTLPPLVAVFVLTVCSNLSAGLTHYGSTTGPIYFGAHFVSQREWWSVGLVASLLNVALWLGTASLWWKTLGVW